MQDSHGDWHIDLVAGIFAVAMMVGLFVALFAYLWLG